MHVSSPAPDLNEPRVAQRDLETLDAMAGLAQRTGSVVHIVVPRAPRVVEYARTLAQATGLDVSVDLLPYSIRVRFAPATVSS